jgi:membrane protein DedA with SNARE-associated domain
MWNTFLLGCGWYLRDNWRVVQKYSHRADIVIIAIFCVGLVWWVRKRWNESRSQATPSGPI